ncbi:trichohyalin isoform X1 [Tachysurus ichikawai]
MGTKRTNRTIEDSLQLPRSPATPERGNQSNEWISREARPQAGPKIQVEQERGGDEWRAREMDRARARPREVRRDVEQDQRESEKYSQFKGRVDEMDLRDRDRRREDIRYTNGNAVSIQQHLKYREREKGDTFPRTMRPNNERERKPRQSVDQSNEKLMDRESEMDMEWADRQRQNCYAEETTGRSSQTQRETDRKIQEEAQSNREWMPGSDVESDKERRRINSFEEKGRKSTSESDRTEEGQDAAYGLRKEAVREGSEKEETEMKRENEQEKSESKKRPRRKMWLEPRSERERTESLQEEFKEREQARERYAQRYKEPNTSRGKDEMPTERKNEGETILLEDSSWKLDATTEFMNDVDTENLEEEIVSDDMVFDSEASSDVPWQTETENVADDMEESDREEEQGSDVYGNSEGEEGHDDWRDKVISVDDGFVTVSSGPEEEETEDRFEDCTEFWDAEDREGLARQSPTITQQKEGEVETRMTKERSDHAVTIFCVVGQTLSRSRPNQNPLLDCMEQDQTSQDSSWEVGAVGGGEHEAPNKDTEAESTSTGPGLSLSEEDMSSSHDTRCDNAESEQMTKEVTPSKDLEISGDLNAEKDTEPYPTESTETLTQTEDHGNAQMKKTDGEIQVEGQNEMESSCQLEEVESTENRKRFSAAPHVKWAKNVVSEILGSTEESGTLTAPEPSTQTEQASDKAPAEAESQGDSPLYGIVQKPRKHSHTIKCIDPETQFKPGNAKTDILVGNEILLQVEGQSDWEELERPSTSPDLLSLSSDNETDKEGSGKKEKKQKKNVWNILGTNSLRDLGNEVWRKKAVIRKTLQKHNEEDEEGERAGDRRTRVFATDNEYDDLSSSWNESDLRTFKGTISRTKMRTSKFYNSQLYQQYSEVVQNRELILQSYSDASSVSGDHDVHAPSASTSPSNSPTLARRPLPPLPPVLHPHSISNTNVVSGGNGLLAVPIDTHQRPSSPRLSRSFASSPMLWQDLPGVRNNPELKLLSEDERRLQEVRFEMVTSESSYCSSLDIVVEHFVKCKQLNVLLTSQEKNWLFSKLIDVRAISHSFFSQLEERVESDIMHFTVCDIIIKHCPQFRAVYVPYLTNQSYQDKTYQRLMNENPGFHQIVDKLEQSPKCQRLPLRSFLILPFQRITRLKLLVQNIVKRTETKTVDETQAIKAMKLLEKMIQDSNDSISQMKNIESLVSLNAKVDFECKTLPLISQSRRLVKEGQVSELRNFTVKEKERSGYIHLFNDYLLLSLPKEGGRFTVIDHAPVSELRAENCKVKLHSLQKNVFRLHMAQRTLILRTETQADKLRWISALSRPHPEIDFTAAQNIPQMQCIRAFVAQQPDELSLEKADVLLVHEENTDGWVEGTRLSDRLRGWVPESHLETIVSEKVRQRNLIDMLKITTATATT